MVRFTRIHCNNGRIYVVYAFISALRSFDKKHFGLRPALACALATIWLMWLLARNYKFDILIAVFRYPRSDQSRCRDSCHERKLYRPTRSWNR